MVLSPVDLWAIQIYLQRLTGVWPENVWTTWTWPRCLPILPLILVKKPVALKEIVTLTGWHGHLSGRLKGKTAYKCTSIFNTNPNISNILHRHLNPHRNYAFTCIISGGYCLLQILKPKNSKLSNWKVLKHTSNNNLHHVKILPLYGFQFKI